MPFYPVANFTASAIRPTEPYNGRKLVRAPNGWLWCVYNKYVSHGGGSQEIWAAYSSDRGLTWTEELVYMEAGPDFVSPSIAVDSTGQLHVVFDNAKGIEYTVRDLAGVWSDSEVIEMVTAYCPSLAIDSLDKLHVVCTAKGSPTFPAMLNIRYYYKDIGGLWSAEWVTDVEADQWYPAIAIDSLNNVHVVWQGRGWGVNPGVGNIQYCKRTGVGWGAQVGLSDYPGPNDQVLPQICIGVGNNIHVLWSIATM